MANFSKRRIGFSLPIKLIEISMIKLHNKKRYFFQRQLNIFKYVRFYSSFQLGGVKKPTQAPNPLLQNRSTKVAQVTILFFSILVKFYPPPIQN
jgi:hypothetical protein